MTVRCPECRTRRTTFAALVEHVRKTGHHLCRCGGYHFAHRPGSPYCDANPRAGLNRALREVDTEDQVLQLIADWNWDMPGTPSLTCPF